ncbi:alpha/beta hydrolase [Lentilactobacillus hilgardii]|nr:alpha/beta hydrolase [Lentilactobacillus hilgardii]MBZ2203066.1 alpha/beta hydrolase [Lentilactobacillus hilgardii]
MKVIFLHGLGQTADAWEKVTDRMASSDYLTMSLFKPISRTDHLTIEKLHLILSQELDRIREPYILCGLSLGAILALKQAITPSLNLKGLVLSGAQFEAPNSGLLVFQNLIFKFLPRRTFTKLGITKRQAIDLTDSLRNLHLTSELSKMALPALVICGKRDRANLKASHRLEGLLSDGELVIIPNAKHELNLENPLEFAQALNRFLNKVNQK